MNNVTEIPLTNGGVTLVDSPIPDEFSHRNWQKSPEGYAYTCVGLGSRGNHRTVYLHRIINDTPVGFITDHINGDRLDNRKANLRTVTKGQNTQRGRKAYRNGKATSRYKGVYRSNGRGLWIAQVRFENKTRSLGGYKTERDAAIAYNGAVSLLYGDFAFLNSV